MRIVGAAIEGSSQNRTAARVAVVDDDVSIRTSMSRLLKYFNVKVELYSEAGDFLDSLSEGLPDCLLLDLHMPNINGIDVLKYLRARSIELTTVIVSADDNAEIRETCSRLGAAAFLSKPLDVDLLLQFIRAARKSPSSARPSNAASARPTGCKSTAAL